MRNVVFLLVVLAACAVRVEGAVEALSLAQKVEGADAIVVGEIGNVRTQEFAIVWYKTGSDGQVVRRSTHYDLGVVKVGDVLKGDRPGLVNKADASNPVDWRMSVASPSEHQEPSRYEMDLDLGTLKQGRKGVWFLKHDSALTGHYFVMMGSPVPEGKVLEIRKLLSDAAAKK